MRVLTEHFRKLVELAKQDEDFKASHSIEEARIEHERKQANRSPRSGAVTAPDELRDRSARAAS
ncbi:unnamed protein product [Gemmata massiliana]|uniref:Uncharacterized protein n=1 Tax=Gemmata massiliana TaxID=1210884 RepID=A0A6P2DFX7_9BACT|nr:hypothetical protein [Gemmata massiliana]VTS00572.1 unnamed protein product [Gemmata massiliana]